jgi:hypothetical protein
MKQLRTCQRATLWETLGDVLNHGIAALFITTGQNTAITRGSDSLVLYVSRVTVWYCDIL